MTTKKLNNNGKPEKFLPLFSLGFHFVGLPLHPGLKPFGSKEKQETSIQSQVMPFFSVIFDPFETNLGYIMSQITVLDCF